MSIINDRDFPIVFVNIAHDTQEEHNHAEDLKEFEKLVSRHEKFVLINEGGSPDREYKHNREETKMVNNFMRRNRAKLKEFAVAMIHIEPSSLKRLAFKPFHHIFEKFWGMKLAFVSDRAEAVHLANSLLRLEKE
ncbi:hypothetical protein BWD42_04885 [Sphingobacterium sp. CZ-UAM]|uniref:hypothetical protein n=1 Tax=unclassified Sphingobacterium TaxID=2609468 RepID=UPI0009864259|nr:hypothetical protein [Sphingobacterium sp. CZ-UAM]OOG19279.1 hypothetical protein BWD42_04885 [Sphingobacterium sp. CZ-UAM]